MSKDFHFCEKCGGRDVETVELTPIKSHSGRGIPISQMDADVLDSYSYGVGCQQVMFRCLFCGNHKVDTKNGL